MGNLRYPISLALVIGLVYGCSSVQQREPAPETPIAVLPFVSFSNDPELALFGEMLSEDILTALVQVDTRALARSSSFQFRDGGRDVREIGRQLNVDRVLEGSVSKAGTKVRIVAQLVSAVDGPFLWSDSFEKEPIDLPAFRSDVSEAIAWSLVKEAGFAIGNDLPQRIDAFVQLGVDLPVKFESVNVTRMGLEATFIASNNDLIRAFQAVTADAGFPELNITSIHHLPSVGPKASRVEVTLARFQDRRAWRSTR